MISAPRSLTTALLLLATTATPVLAQDASGNDAVIDQAGADNLAQIDQTGALNRAGSDEMPLLQQGYWNALTILQEGRGNRVGLSGRGLFQDGIETSTTVHNSIDITQNSEGNRVGELRQRALGPVPHGANSLTIVQLGGMENLVSEIAQIQEGGQARQIMDLRQTGTRNTITRAAQYASSVVENAPNEMTVSMSGSYNGRSGLSGFAAHADITDSSLIQEGGTSRSLDSRGNGNSLALLIPGSSNRFGLRQSGRDNFFGPLILAGNSNQIGFRQEGNQNTFEMSVIEGDDNVLGLDQLGTNMAELRLLGSSGDNAVWLRQNGTNWAIVTLEGTSQEVQLDQDYLAGQGGTNRATLSLKGAENRAEVRQFGANQLNLAIIGVRNNDGRHNGSAEPAGLFVQEGKDNLLEGRLSGEENKATTLQKGQANTIDFMVLGQGNDAIISQIGAENIAHLVQSGSGNRARIRQ